MPNDDTHGGAVVAGLPGTHAAGGSTVKTGAGGPAFDRQVTGSGR